MHKIKIICTIGPSSSSPSILKKLNKEGVNIFRINMSHTDLTKLPKTLSILQKHIDKDKICIDTEGAQLRTTLVKKKIYLKKNKIIKIFNDKNISTKKKIFFYPKFDILSIPNNTKIYVGFGGIILKVINRNKNNNSLIAKVIEEGNLESNKGVHIDYKINLSCLTEKDISAINYSMKRGIKNFAMSFVNSAKDIQSIRKIIGKKSFLISKIETLNAIKNLKKISTFSNAILIDRGDLSREVSIEKIPLAQKYIVDFAKKNSIPVYIATNLLETMVKDLSPTRAESHDIYSTLNQGAFGLVLAAETAIGKYPVECVKFLKKCIKIYNKSFKKMY